MPADTAEARIPARREQADGHHAAGPRGRPLAYADRGRIDPGTHTLAASLVDLQTWRDRPVATEVTKRFDAVKKFAVRGPFGTSRQGLFELLDGTGKPIPFRPARRARSRQPEAAALAPPVAEAVAFSVDVAPTGGRLILHKADVAVTAAPVTTCGDVDRTRSEGAVPGTPVVEFRPAVEIKGNPLAREIHAVITSKPTDMVPRTELRISGGAEDETDTSSRLSIGTSAGTKGTWLPSVQMDGGKRLEIRAVDGAPEKALLKVDGAVYLPPIGKKDPLLPDLLALAFISGLRQIGKISPDVTLSLTTVPGQVARGTPLTYEMKVTWSGQVQVKRCIEIIRGRAGNGEVVFRTIEGIDLRAAGVASPKTFAITFPNFKHTASKVRIEIQMLVARGTATTVAVATSADITVV